MKTPDILQAITPVITAFEKLSVPYYIGGSIASSVYGISRATMDVDVVADIKASHVTPLKQLLENKYYIDEEMITDAILRMSSFNLIHLETMIKIDVFVNKPASYTAEAFRRKKKDTLEESEEAYTFYFASPEDIVLNKLLWYEAGERVSERQWLDVIGVIKVQGVKLDMEYLKHWGKILKLSDVLKSAFHEAGYDF